MKNEFETEINQLEQTKENLETMDDYNLKYYEDDLEKILQDFDKSEKEFEKLTEDFKKFKEDKQIELERKWNLLKRQVKRQEMVRLTWLY